jgi:hypothetical protein
VDYADSGVQRLLLQVAMLEAADACLQPLLQLLVSLCTVAAGAPFARRCHI